MLFEYLNADYCLNSSKILGLMIFALFRGSNGSSSSWRYASTLVPDPYLKLHGDGFDKLASVHL